MMGFSKINAPLQSLERTNWQVQMTANDEKKEARTTSTICGVSRAPKHSAKEPSNIPQITVSPSAISKQSQKPTLKDLLNIKTNYELWASEDAILSNIETQMSNVGLLICNNSPEQALWHLRGLVRHGGSLDQARFAQELGLAVAKQFDAKTGKILMVDEVDPASWALPA